MLDEFKQLTSNKAEINVQGIKKEVRKLTVSEIEQYQDIINQGIGNMQTGLNAREGQKANINLEKFAHKQNEADKYLIRRSFLDKDGNEVVTEQDIDELYDVYNDLVSELHRVNHINQEDPDALNEAIQK